MTKTDRLGQRLCLELKAGKMTVADISEAIGEERRAVADCLFRLKAEGIVVSEYDPKIQTNRWRFAQSEAVEKLPLAIPETEKRQRILSAVRAGFSLPRAIALEAGLGESETIVRLIALENEVELERKNGVNFSAWFLPGKVPKGKLVLDGMGGVREVPIPDCRVSDSVRAAAEAKLAAQNSSIKKIEREMKKEKEMENNSNGDKPVAAISSASAGDSREHKSKGKYSEEIFENFGRRGLNKKAIAAELGISETGVYLQLKKEKLKAAYERGMSEVEKRVSEEILAAPTDAVNVARRREPFKAAEDIDFEPEDNQDEPVADLQVPPGVEIDPRFAGTLARVARNEASRAGIQKKLDQMVVVPPTVEEEEFQPAPAEVVVEPVRPGGVSGKAVSMGGGTMRVELDGVNLFKMSRRERQILFGLIDDVEKFEKKREARQLK